MGDSQKQSAIRRSTRLPLEIPVLVTSLDAQLVFSAECRTTLVNAHGCGLVTQRALPSGIQIRLEIVSAKRHTTARVTEVVSLGGDPETWLLGLELDNPGNFWGLEYAPADWTIDDTTSPMESNGKGQGPLTAGRPAPPAQRWRLTDISPGACYLETAVPFPLGTAVLVSIRVENSEHLLDGVVRASHPKSGMGVEFTPRAQDHQSRTEQLIQQLLNHREVPRVLVGRREGRKPDELKVDAATVAAKEPESPDPLLELIREGESLPVEQFLDDLKTQRLGQRREPRIEVSLPVRLTGTDIRGRPLDQRVTTVNISRRGALLEGIHGTPKVGDRIFLSRGDRREQFCVAWVGPAGTPGAGQIGVVAVEPNPSFWGEVLETTAATSSVSSARSPHNPGKDGG